MRIGGRSTRRGDGAKSLHELLDFEGVPEEARKYIGNYGIHILDVRNMPDEELQKFQGDIGFMLLLIKHAKDKKALGNLAGMPEYREIGEDTLDALAEYLNEPVLMSWKEKSEKEGDESMCEGLRELTEETIRTLYELVKAHPEEDAEKLLKLLGEDSQGK